MNKQTKNNNYYEILPKLKIYGYSDIEDLILAGLVTGDPVLLIGRHGTAKTMLTEALARSLGMKFIAYDASKAMFEDVIGFPSPKSLQEANTIEYVPTPLSIWDKEFILIDEISRATPSMQSKWLEIIRSRQIMGKKVENLKYVFAAMNPPGEYIGAMPLDEALASRFAFIITVPEACNMQKETLVKIIENVSSCDAVAATSLHNGNNVTAPELKELITKAISLMKDVEKEYNNIIITYITNITFEFWSRGFKIDGRRLGMIRRNLLAYISILLAKCNDKSFIDDNISKIFLKCLKVSLPIEIQQNEETKKVLEIIHTKSLKVKFSDICDKIEIGDDDFDIIRKNLNLFNTYDDNEKNRIVSKFFELAGSADVNELDKVYFLLLKFVELVTSNKNNISTKITSRILEYYMQKNAVTNTERESWKRIPRYSVRYIGTDLKLILSDPIANIVYRLISNFTNEDRSSVDHTDFDNLYVNIETYIKNYKKESKTI